MAQKSGFFNALLQNGVYDRKYNANDYSDNLAAVISNGVLRSANNDLQVTASGRIVSVAAGRAWINGRYYINDSSYAFDEVTAPTTGSRYDRVMLRLNTQLGSFDTSTERTIRLVYVQGTASNNPVPPEPTRTGEIYDLVLATVYAAAGASSLVITDTRGTSGLCDWLYSNSKGYLYMRYNWTQTLNSSTNTVQFNIPQYESNKGFLEVYVNGILDNNASYTLNNNIITFSGTLTAGTIVTVRFYKSIEATGIDTVAGAITTLQNQMAQVQSVAKFTYQCTGLNDNIALSEIALAFYNGSYTVGSLTTAAEAFLTNLGGNTYLATLDSEFQAEIDVVGKLNVTTPYSGGGTSVNYYNYFVLDNGIARNKRLIFNFSKCDTINISITSASTYNNIFRGTNIDVRNAKVKVNSSSASVNVLMVSSSSNAGEVYFEKCNFKIETTGYALISRSGNFINCNMFVKSASDYARCVDCQAATGMLYLSGGTYYAYSGNSSILSGVIFTGGGVPDAVTIAENINCPTNPITGYTQQYFVYTASGSTLINGVISTLAQGGSATYRVVNNLIQRNKVR